MEPSPYAEQRYKDGLDCARRATQYDQSGNYRAALAFYNEAVEALTHATSLAPVFTPILKQVGSYSRRLDEIRQYLSAGSGKQGRKWGYLMTKTVGDQIRVSGKDQEGLSSVTSIDFPNPSCLPCSLH